MYHPTDLSRVPISGDIGVVVVPRDVMLELVLGGLNDQNEEKRDNMNRSGVRTYKIKDKLPTDWQPRIRHVTALDTLQTTLYYARSPAPCAL